MDTFKIVNKVCKILGRNYQISAFKKIIKSTIGRVNMATGTGKTWLAAAVTMYYLLKNKNKFGVYVVQAPVILLTYQLMTEFVKFFSHFKIELMTLFTHSGSKNQTEEWEYLKSQWYNVTGKPIIDAGATLRKDQIIEQLELAKQFKQPLLVVSTYQSSSYLGKILRQQKINPEVVIADESHYLVSEKNSELFEDEQITQEQKEAVTSFPAKRKYFFTATEKWTDAIDGIGLNNVKKYGKILFQYLPREAIKDGYLVAPRGGVLKLDNDVKDITTKGLMGRTISLAFKEMSRLQKKHNETVPKILIKANGSTQLKWATESDQTKKLIKQGVNVFVIGSTIGNWYNGKLLSRSQWIDKAKKIGSDPTQPMIVIHLRIVTVGFDIPGFNSFIPLSVLTTINAIQNIGRIVRLSPGKKMAIIAVPGFILNRDNVSRFERLVDSLTSEYGWSGADFVNDWMDPDAESDDKNELQIPKKKKKEAERLAELLNDMKFKFWKKRVPKKNVMTAFKSIFENNKAA